LLVWVAVAGCWACDGGGGSDVADASGFDGDCGWTIVSSIPEDDEADVDPTSLIAYVLTFSELVSAADSADHLTLTANGNAIAYEFVIGADVPRLLRVRPTDGFAYDTAYVAATGCNSVGFTTMAAP